MKIRKSLFVTLAAIAFAVYIPGLSFADSPQPVGGVATVIGVDQPDNCLRIRSGPGNSYDVIGCANMGDQLNITGVWTSNDWAQLADNGWVYGPQLQTDLRPPADAFSNVPDYDVTTVISPDYDDWAYLPDYGYSTYWYSGVPIFFYNIGCWNRFHPWWWRHGHQAWWWQNGHHGRRNWDAASFNNFVRSGGSRNFVATNRNLTTNQSNISALNRAGTNRNFTNRNLTNRNLTNRNFTNRNLTNRNFTNRNLTTNPNISSLNRNTINRNFSTNRSNSANINRFNANVNRFNANANRFRSGSTNTFRSFSTPNTFRSGSTNTFRSRNFTPTFRSGNLGGSHITSMPNVQRFSAPHISSTPHFNSSAGAGRVNVPHVNPGAGAHIGGAVRHR